MNQQTVLAAFDEQIRRHSAAEAPGERVERDAGVVRFVAGESGRSAVTWSGLAEATADAVIATTIDRFARLGASEWEWKYYSYDRPADLPRRLLAAGFTAEPAEALMVAEIEDLARDVPPPAGVQLRPVTEPWEVDALVRVHDEVFGEDHAALGRELLSRLARRPLTVAAVVAVADDTPISAGRVEFHSGTEFASLWGGGTVRGWRGRGVFRSLVAHRAALADLTPARSDSPRLLRAAAALNAAACRVSRVACRKALFELPVAGLLLPGLDAAPSLNALAAAWTSDRDPSIGEADGLVGPVASDRLKRLACEMWRAASSAMAQRL